MQIPIRLRQSLLFAAGCVFAALILPVASSGIGEKAAQGLILWLAFYPFATSVQLRERDYWLVLAVGLPIMLLAQSSTSLAPVLKTATLVVFAIALAGVLVRQFAMGRKKA